MSETLATHPGALELLPPHTEIQLLRNSGLRRRLQNLGDRGLLLRDQGIEKPIYVIGLGGDTSGELGHGGDGVG